jgi:histidinol dehydrogenase
VGVNRQAAAQVIGYPVDQFQRRTSLVEYSRPALKKALRSVQQFARIEGLAAHGLSAERRLE